MPDDPGGQHAAAAAAGDEQPLRVDVAASDHGVDARHEVVVVLVRVVVMNQIGELLAVAGAAARIHVENHVARGGVQLYFRGKARRVHGERTAVNFQHEGIFLRRIEPGRLHDPALHVAMIGRGIEADFLERADRALRQQIVAQSAQAS